MTRKIQAGLEADHAYVVAYEEIARIADALDNDEPIEPAALIKQYRVER